MLIGSLIQNQNNLYDADQNGYKQMVANLLGNFFEWPNITYFSNALKSLLHQYISNVQTSLSTHSESRLKKCFKMRVYEMNHLILRQNVPNPVLFDANDIKNAINYTCNRRDSTRGNVEALQRLGVLLDGLRDV